MMVKYHHTELRGTEQKRQHGIKSQPRGGRRDRNLNGLRQRGKQRQPTKPPQSIS